MDNKNLGNCVPCEDKGHECQATNLVDVAGEKEPWCADCFAGKRVCSYERNKRAAAAGISVKASEPGAIQLEAKALSMKLPEPREEAMKEPVIKSATVKFCACSSDCDKPSMAGREFAWGHKPKKTSSAEEFSAGGIVGNKNTEVIGAHVSDDFVPRKTADKLRSLADKVIGTGLPFEIKTVSRDEYRDKFEVARGRNEALIKLVEFACKGKIGVVHIIKPEKRDSPRRFRDRIRRTFVRHFSKTVDFDLYVSQNVKHNHVAIEKVKR